MASTISSTPTKTFFDYHKAKMGIYDYVRRICSRLCGHEGTICYTCVNCNAVFQDEKIYQYLHDETAKIYPDWKVINPPSWQESDILFEVKTSIPSLGELIRQINMYRAYKKSRFYVVSTDDKFLIQLLEQNIGFVRYPTGEVCNPISV